MLVESLPTISPGVNAFECILLSGSLWNEIFGLSSASSWSDLDSDLLTERSDWSPRLPDSGATEFDIISKWIGIFVGRGWWGMGMLVWRGEEG